ncbi:hypothetical protein U1Q18_013927 [Sarracenia purpurea var. burkii]
MIITAVIAIIIITAIDIVIGVSGRRRIESSSVNGPLDHLLDFIFVDSITLDCSLIQLLVVTVVFLGTQIMMPIERRRRRRVNRPLESSESPTCTLQSDFIFRISKLGFDVLWVFDD